MMNRSNVKVRAPCQVPSWDHERDRARPSQRERTDREDREWQGKRRRRMGHGEGNNRACEDRSDHRATRAAQADTGASAEGNGGLEARSDLGSRRAKASGAPARTPRIGPRRPAPKSESS